jgi:cytoskeleton protein RodZ
MSEQPDSALPAGGRPTTAGGLLKQARQAQGLHIAALAAAIKVVPRKLELLESDQFDQLPDATFTRALAQTVCRSLKIDAAPILALLPPPKGHRLEQVAEGLNTPFHERPGRLEPQAWVSLANPMLWVVGLIVVLTIAVYAMPAGWLPFANSGLSRSKPPDAAVKPAAVSTTTTTIVSPPPASAAAASAPVAAVPAAAAASEPAVVGEPDAVTAAAASGMLQFRAVAASWVEVTDARGQSLISRVLQPGENVGLDGVMPLKVKIGNAVGTRLVFKGQPLELATYTRDNVARLELK